MTDQSKPLRISNTDRPDGVSRRELLRRIGIAGVGAVGVGLIGCKNRPEEDLIDLTNEPQVLQLGGTISGQLTGLLTGVSAGLVTVRLAGLGEVTADEAGRFEVRVQQPGDYRIQFTGKGFRKRESIVRLNGNVTLNESLLEDDAGLSNNFLNQYARATGPNGKEGIVPRTPGATNRWTRPMRIKIYRRLADSPRDVVPEARLTAMQGSIAALFGPLTANRIGFPSVEVRSGSPPGSLGEVPAGVMVIAQTRDGGLGTSHGSSVTDVFDINKAITACGVDSPIEIFNRVFAHALGGYVVANTSDSILNAHGRAAPSAEDRQAATFLYTRSPGNSAPDQDPSGVFINA